MNATKEQASSTGFFFGWWIVAVNAVSYLSGGIMVYSASILFPFMMKEYGWTRADLGTAMALYTWGNVIWGLIIGAIATKIGNRKTIILGSVILMAGELLMSTITTIPQVYIYYSIMGGFAATSIMGVGVMALTRNWFMKKAGTATGVINSIWGLGAGLLFPLMGTLAATYGWRNTLIMFALVLNGIALLGTLLIVRERPEDKNLNVDGLSAEGAQAMRKAIGGMLAKEASMDSKQAIKTPQLWIVAICFGLQNLAMMGPLSQITLIAESAGIALAAVATLMSAFMLPSIVGRFFGGWLGDKLGKKNAIPIGALIAAVVFVLMALFGKTPSGVYILFAALGLTLPWATTNYPPFFGDLFGRLKLGSVMGVILVIQGVITGFGPYIVGQVSQATGEYTLVYYFLAVVCVLQAGLVAFALKPTEVELINSGKKAAPVQQPAAGD